MNKLFLYLSFLGMTISSLRSWNKHVFQATNLLPAIYCTQMNDYFWTWQFVLFYINNILLLYSLTYIFILQALIKNLLCIMHGWLCVVPEILSLQFFFLLTVNLNLSLALNFKWCKKVLISLKCSSYILTFLGYM